MNIVTGGCSYSETQHCVDYTRHDMDVDLFDYDNYKSWALHLGDIVSSSVLYFSCIFKLHFWEPSEQLLKDFDYILRQFLE